MPQASSTPSAKRHRNDVDSTPMSVMCRFTCRFRLESGPEIDMLATFDVESKSFRCLRIFLSHWEVPRVLLNIFFFNPFYRSVHEIPRSVLYHPDFKSFFGSNVPLLSPPPPPNYCSQRNRHTLHSIPKAPSVERALRGQWGQW